jgi:hypothetical protein
MGRQVFRFVPPIIGMNEEFNTFRKGSALAAKVAVEDVVTLHDSRAKIDFGLAVVLSVETGVAQEMLRLHAHRNHTEIANSDVEGAPERLLKTLQRIYRGAKYFSPETTVTVVYLRRIE